MQRIGDEALERFLAAEGLLAETGYSQRAFLLVGAESIGNDHEE